MADKNQKMRFSEGELALIKSTFAENEDLLKAIRKSMLQLPMNAVDLALVSNNFRGKGNVMALMRKAFLPQLEGDAPIHQVIDLWMTVKLDGLNHKDAMLILQARRLLLEYIEQQLNWLENGNTKVIIKFEDLSDIDGKDSEQIYVEMIARNTMITHTENQLQGLDILSGMKDETVDQMKKRLEKNSTK